MNNNNKKNGFYSLKMYLFVFSVYECLACMRAHIACVPGAHEGWKRTSDPLEPE